jgi:hypothetical protein
MLSRLPTYSNPVLVRSCVTVENIAPNMQSFPPYVNKESNILTTAGKIILKSIFDFFFKIDDASFNPFRSYVKPRPTV